ncbi:MAG: TIM barrel protein [Actinomycetaceae bacterium]|nr:TIM barrel protein [Actinomycetaceae bacterium]
MGASLLRGVSLYSYQHEYAHGQLDLAGCVHEAVKVGALGIETLGEQMIPGFPFPGGPDLPESFYAQWAQLMDEVGATPTVHDMFLDTKRYAHRLMNHDEMVDSLRRDIRHTAKMGAKGIRIIVNTPPEVVEAAASYAADHGVWMGVEIHAPYHFGDEWIQRHLDVANRVGTDVVGCVPDLGIFVDTFPRVVSDRALRDGADPEAAREIVDTYNSGGDSAALFARLESEGVDPVTLGLARQGTFMINAPVSCLSEYADTIKHIHSKFYEMHKVDGFDYWHEYSIPYHEIIPELHKAGFQGYISSEYEGNRHIEDAEKVDSIQQVARHQEMLAALIGQVETHV